MRRPQTIPAARITGCATPLNICPRQRELQLRRMPLATEPKWQSWIVVMTLPPFLIALGALLEVLS